MIRKILMILNKTLFTHDTDEIGRDRTHGIWDDARGVALRKRRRWPKYHNRLNDSEKNLLNNIFC